ncbi:MAG TPA: ABC transporter ATP-binding protein [Acidobacteriota bacterium]|nr:ABC transporter ATP-binding protein [Acidobacteriota bacterium]
MIQIAGLSKSFGAFEAVKDLSLDIGRGETFALLGPNGSGKTTTLRCLVGLASPSSGRIIIDGLDAGSMPRETRRLVSYLPQRVCFHDSLTAREVLAFYCRIRRLPSQRVDEVLATTRFNFNGFSDKPVRSFSGGMLQRLGLAVACLPDAPILILDEPMINLDPEGAIRFREFLRRLRGEGRTIVFSSHVLSDVELLADRVAILVGGRLVALESMEALRDGVFRHSSMRLTLDNPGPSWAEAARLHGAEDVVEDGNQLIITSKSENRLQILRAIEAAGGRITRFATREPSLEDLYLRYAREKDASVCFPPGCGVRDGEADPR